MTIFSPHPFWNSHPVAHFLSSHANLQALSSPENSSIFFLLVIPLRMYHTSLWACTICSSICFNYNTSVSFCIRSYVRLTGLSHVLDALIVLDTESPDKLNFLVHIHIVALAPLRPSAAKLNIPAQNQVLFVWCLSIPSATPHCSRWAPALTDRACQSWLSGISPAIVNPFSLAGSSHW